MTRINLVPPAELMDQHLFAEFREIKMVPKALARSLRAAEMRVGKKSSIEEVKKRIPKEFTLGTGHVMFFYDKGKYLCDRYDQIRIELRKRGINFDKNSQFDPEKTMVMDWFNHYVPTSKSLEIIRERIAEKIAMKPSWYRKTTSFVLKEESKLGLSGDTVRVEWPAL